MDHAVALVQAYLQLNGYFTSAEYPIIAGAGRGFRTNPRAPTEGGASRAIAIGMAAFQCMPAGMQASCPGLAGGRDAGAQGAVGHSPHRQSRVPTPGVISLPVPRAARPRA